MMCWITRQRILRTVESGEALSRSAKAHITSCAACGDFYRTQEGLSRKLRLEAALHRVASPASIRLEVARRLEMAAAIDSELKPRVFLIRPAWSVPVLVVLIGWLFYLSSSSRRHEETVERLAGFSSVDEWHQIAIRPANWPGREEVQQWSEKLEDPLERELQAVIGDTKAVIQTLAQNFLPAGPAQGGEAQP